MPPDATCSQVVMNREQRDPAREYVHYQFLLRLATNPSPTWRGKLQDACDKYEERRIGLQRRSAAMLRVAFRSWSTCLALTMPTRGARRRQ